MEILGNVVRAFLQEVATRKQWRTIELVRFPVAIVKCWCANTLQGTLCSKQCILQGVVGGRCVDDGDGSCVRAGDVKTACLGRESYFFLIVSLRRVVVLCCGAQGCYGEKWLLRCERSG